MDNELLQGLHRLHSTELGIERIRKNLGLDVEDVVLWCKEQIENAEEIFRKGKNWYTYTGDICITVNAHSFTIITAHRGVGHVEPPAVKVEGYTREELREALLAIDSTIAKCEKALPKLREGSSQHTLLVRRIKALRISSELIAANYRA